MCICERVHRGVGHAFRCVERCVQASVQYGHCGNCEVWSACEGGRHCRAPWLLLASIRLTVRVTLVAVKGKHERDGYFYCREGLYALCEGMITRAQIRAARALIGWKQTDLAKAASVSEMSIKNIERGDTDPRVSTLQAIQTALEAAGVIFVPENGEGVGVRLKKERQP